MARPIGAQNKDKPYRDALRRAIARANDSDAPHKLDRIADAHLLKCSQGDISAMRELADRLDGKVPQAVVGDDEHAPIRTESVPESELMRRLLFLIDRAGRENSPD